MTRPAKNPGLLAIQTGLYKAISGASITVYDEPSENAPFPYATIGESSTVDDGSKTDHGDEHYETIHVWSRAKGFKECKTLMASIISAISGYSFSESGYNIRFIEIDQVTSFRDPDGLTRHGVVRAKFKVMQE
jgi:hypothetical protein